MPPCGLDETPRHQGGGCRVKSGYDRRRRSGQNVRMSIETTCSSVTAEHLSLLEGPAGEIVAGLHQPEGFQVVEAVRRKRSSGEQSRHEVANAGGEALLAFPVRIGGEPQAFTLRTDHR